MKATMGRHYLERDACYRTYTIDIEHKRGCHSEQVVVYGNQALAVEIARLINGQWAHRHTDQFNSAPDTRDEQ